MLKFKCEFKDFVIVIIFLISLLHEKTLSNTGILFIFPTKISFKCNRFGAKSLPFKCSTSFTHSPSLSLSASFIASSLWRSL